MLAILLPLVKLENILLSIFLPLVNAGEYYVGYNLAINECRRIIYWLLTCYF